MISRTFVGTFLASCKAVVSSKNPRLPVMKIAAHATQTRCLLAVVAFSWASADFLSATPQLPPEGALEIAEFIQMDMRSDSKMQGADVHVRIQNELAILTGPAISLAQVERATNRAIASAGVRAVVNQMRVTPAAAKTIAANAKAALAAQKMAVTDQVKFTVSGDRLIVSGSVGTLDESELVREILSEVPGVGAVENRLEVTFEGVRSDAQIAEQLRFLINDDPLYAGLDLAVSVSAGKVKISGSVGNRGEFDRLVRRCHVTGVFEVQNAGLNLDPALAMEGLVDKFYTDEESLAALQEALRADDRIESSRISAAVIDGFATLKGSVRSTAESDAVELTARGIPGVLHVTNQLKIAQGAQLAGELRQIKSASAPGLKRPRN
jgi:osmotically-inducible protein OsmY